MATKISNFEKIYRRALDTHEELTNQFSAKEIEAINNGNGIYVAYATDYFFSGWGHSKNKLNHVFVICWNSKQCEAVHQSLENAKEMKRANRCSLEYFLTKIRKAGTWSCKNANDCCAWNKGIIIKMEA